MRSIGIQELTCWSAAAVVRWYGCAYSWNAGTFEIEISAVQFFYVVAAQWKPK